MSLKLDEGSGPTPVAKVDGPPPGDATMTGAGSNNASGAGADFNKKPVETSEGPSLSEAAAAAEAARNTAAEEDTGEAPAPTDTSGTDGSERPANSPKSGGAAPSSSEPAPAPEPEADAPKPDAAASSDASEGSGDGGASNDGGGGSASFQDVIDRAQQDADAGSGSGGSEEGGSGSNEPSGDSSSAPETGGADAAPTPTSGDLGGASAGTDDAAPKPLAPGETLADQVVADTNALADGFDGSNLNDGRSQDLTHGNFVGQIDQQIAALQAQQDKYAADAAAATQTARTAIQTANTRTVVATVLANGAGVTNVFKSVFTGDSTSFSDTVDQAQEELEDTLGVEEAQQEAQAAQADARTNLQQASQTGEELDQKAVLNYLSDAAHVSGMPDSLAQVIDGSGGLGVVVDTSLGIEGADAVYDSGSGDIVIGSGVIEDTQAELSQLQAKGIVDAHGNILDANAFDADAGGDQGIQVAAMLGHETTHAAQDVEGVHDEVEQMLADAQAEAAANPEQADQIIADAVAAGEAYRSEALEVQAYTSAELLELQGGRQKGGFLTVNSDGSLLSHDQATANVAAFEAGDALVYGESAGRDFGDGHGAVIGADLLAPSQEDPGRRNPSLEDPGRRNPSLEDPGRRNPSLEDPGRRNPSLEDPGRRNPSLEDPGRRNPSLVDPGRRNPSLSLPGVTQVSLGYAFPPLVTDEDQNEDG